jgi:hypothetical protein
MINLWKTFGREFRAVLVINLVYIIILLGIIITTAIQYGQGFQSAILSLLFTGISLVVLPILGIWGVVTGLMIRVVSVNQYRLLPLTTRNLVGQTLGFGATILIANNLFWRVFAGIIGFIVNDKNGIFHDLAIAKTTLNEIELMILVTIVFIAIKWLHGKSATRSVRMMSLICIVLVAIVVSVIFNVVNDMSGWIGLGATADTTAIIVALFIWLLPKFIDKSYQTY